MTSSLRVVLSLLGLSLLALLITGQDLYGRLAYLWFFVIVGNYLLSRLALRNLAIRRKPRSPKGQVGEIFEETFELINDSRLPRIWVEIEDQSELPGTRGSRVLTLVGGHKIRSYVSRIRLTMRGTYSLGPTIIRSGDPFGFFPVSMRVEAQQDLTVYPRIIDVQTFPSPVGLLPGGDSVRRRTHQITPNASTVREYINGDPISRIHWKSTARRDNLMVKEFELDPLAEVWLFLDCEKKVHASKAYDLNPDVGQVLLGKRMGNKLTPSTEEYMATIAASISQYFLSQDRSLALMMSSQINQDLAPDRGPRQFGKVMESLALMKADGGLPFSAFVLNQARYLTRGSTLILVTPSADPDLEFTVDSLQRLGLRPVPILLNATSFGHSQGNAEIARHFEALQVPSFLINEGENLQAALNAKGRAEFRPVIRRNLI